MAKTGTLKVALDRNNLLASVHPFDWPIDSGSSTAFGCKFENRSSFYRRRPGNGSSRLDALNDKRVEVMNFFSL